MRACAILFFLCFLLSPVFAQQAEPSTPAGIVQLIKKNVTCEWATKTVDTFKAGNPDTPLKGIAVCMFADMPVLKEAVKRNCNFIITHEPIFYNHLDNTEAFEKDQVYLEKRKYIEDHDLVVFRFHDHIHRTEPDGIYEGILNKMEWKTFAVNQSNVKFQIPKTSLSDFAKEVKSKLGIESVRIIGDPDMKFTKFAFAAGAPGGMSHIRILQDQNVEVLVAGEAPEWETYLYAVDAVAQGRSKAVIFLGHIKSEEAGMEYCAHWLKTFVPNTNIQFIENKPNFIQF